jgi:cytochrome c oxidase subunit 1
MTITETRPHTSPPPAEPVAAPQGMATVIGTGDHKVIGRLYIVTSLLFLLGTGVLGELLAVNRMDGPGRDTFLHGATVFFEVFTLHTVGAVFLGLIPLILGVALVIVPLQVGARRVAFPRAAAMSFWVYLVAGVMLVVSYGIKGGPGGPSQRGTDLWTVAFAVVLLALMAATVCIVTTVVSLRTPGMTLDRVPLFSWSMVTAGAMWLLTLPVLLATLVLVFVDHHYGKLFFGANEAIYNHVVWAFHQPEVYAIAAPALGFAGDVLAVSARVRHSLHKVAMIAIGLFCVLGFGAFTADLAVPDQKVLVNPQHTIIYAVMAFAAILPPLVLLALWGDTFRRGRSEGKPAPSASALFAMGAFLLVTAGVLVGAAQSIWGLDLQGTLVDSAQAHFVLLGATVAMVGALHWWSTKILGRSLQDLLGLGGATLLVVGAAAMGIADLFSGAVGKKSAGETAIAHGGIQALNYVAAAGGILLLLGFLVVAANLAGALFRRTDEVVPADPWNGYTLEWLTASPPASDNFVELPLVTSEAPLLDRREALADEEVPA